MTGALLEAALLIALGWALGRSFAGEAFWRGFDRLVYFVLLRALLLRSLAEAEFSGAEAGALALSAALAIFALTLILLAARRALGLDGPAFASVYQGSVRSNTYVALATVPALYGEGGLALLALLLAAVVPLVNVLSVLVLSVQGRGRRPGPSEVALSVATNPLIVACALGLLANASGTRLPADLDEALAALSAAALPCGLMAVGAALSLGALGGHARGVTLSAAAKFLALPLLSRGRAPARAATRGLRRPGRLPGAAGRHRILRVGSSVGGRRRPHGQHRDGPDPPSIRCAAGSSSPPGQLTGGSAHLPCVLVFRQPQIIAARSKRTSRAPP